MGALLTFITADEGLKRDKERYEKFKAFSTLFEKDLTNNLERTSIELDRTYFTADAAGWRDYLNYPTVKNFIDGFLNEKAEKSAKLAMGREMDTKDGVRVQKALDEKKKGGQNANIIVMFLPRRDYENSKG